MRGVPQLRIRAVNDKPVDRERDYVLYWMIAARRVRWNFAFDRAIEWVRELGKPLVLFEPLRCGYQWASVRLHRFVLDGMRENQDRLAEHNVLYYPYVEPHAGAGHGLLAALAARACVVVTDEFPAFFLPRMVAAAAQELPICCENGRFLRPAPFARDRADVSHRLCVPPFLAEGTTQPSRRVSRGKSAGSREITGAAKNSCQDPQPLAGSDLEIALWRQRDACSVTD